MKILKVNKNHPNDALKGLTLAIIANYCSGCAEQTSIALASLGASVHEQELRPSSESGMRRKGTRYSRLESHNETEGVEDGHSLRLGI